jgi:predicted metalloprotease
MRWEKSGRSRNLEDRRGGGIGRAGGMGIGGVVVVLLIALITKQNSPSSADLSRAE